MAWKRAEGGLWHRHSASKHHICVDRPQKQSFRRGRRAGAGRDTAPQHNAHVAGPQRLWRGRGSPGRGSTVQYFVRPGATGSGIRLRVETHNGLVHLNYIYMGTCAPSAKRAVPASSAVIDLNRVANEMSRCNHELHSAPPLGLAYNLLDHGVLETALRHLDSTLHDTQRNARWRHRLAVRNARALARRR